MKVFLIEDEPYFVDIFQDFCDREGIQLAVASNLADAMAEIGRVGHEIDIAVCDLKIPSVAGAIDEDVVHGLTALNTLISRWPGVPAIVVSAFGTVDVVGELLLTARQVDIYGTGTRLPMLRFKQKADVLQATEVLRDARRQLDELGQIELSAPELPPMYRQSLRVFARRRRGRLVHYRPLSGGLSGAQTGLATVKGAYGEDVAYVVAKMTRYDRALEELERYRKHVAGRLTAGAYADLTDEVLGGCGDAAALLYSVANGESRDLFTVITEDAALGAEIVTALRDTCSPWLAGVPQTARTWLDVRRTLISDPGFADVAAKFDVGLTPETKAVQARWASQHGDLHGANVLVDNLGRPVLIDYGRTGEASCTLDPLTLELSPLFHASSSLRNLPWPSLDDIERWDDLEAYISSCPYPSFIRAARAWTNAVRAGEREMYATLSALCLRNLQYGDVDHARALALQRLAARRLNEL